ncbi:MAG: response regulator [Magnetococcales bacterium]|nr:response regulator [Magnetococcales bacterium]
MKSTILLVDDEDVNLELLQGVLKDDYTLVCAKNGPKALALAAQKPDLILLDIMMPGMDGYEVCRRLKANEQTKDIPIIFVASKREMADEIDGLKIGASDYIAKPISHLEVKARVKAYIALGAADKSGQETDTGCGTCRALQEPLDGVVRLVDALLQDNTLAAEQKKSLLAIWNQGFHALCVLNLSLSLLSMEQGTYKLKPVNLDLLPLLRTIRAYFEPIIRSKRLTLKVQLQNQADAEKNAFFVRGEKMLSYVLLANLVKRAMEAAPNDQTITISIEDTGKIGIVRICDPSAVPTDLREQFFAKDAPAGKGSEAGSGAYSAKLITELQGGRIRMRTDETKGTEIVFSIPKGEADE